MEPSHGLAYRAFHRCPRVALHVGPMTEPNRTRNRLLNVRLLETETAMLAELATGEHVTVSEWIRNVIRREHALAFRAAPKRARSRKR